MKDKFIKIDLQFFGEKTEQPTQKKLDDSRKKGQVAQSKELTGAICLFVAVYMIKIFGKDILSAIIQSMAFLKDFMYRDNLTNHDSFLILVYMMLYILKAVAYVIIPVFITAAVTQRYQVGNIFTFETLKPKLSRLNPVEGFKRMFSKQAIMNLVKSLFKIFLVGYVGYNYIAKNIGLVLKSIQLESNNALALMATLSIEVAIRMAAIILLVGVVDYIYQLYSFNKNMKMSKQEIKDEYKNAEGDPQIKSKIKQRQREIAQRRMIEDVPNADVIITNPTHFAVALKYDDEKFDAPYVIAKGKDLIAQKIKEKAKEHKVPIVENKPLARQLYRELEIGDFITQEMYEAVAEILAYVYSLRKEKKI